MQYSPLVHRYFFSPKHAGQLDPTRDLAVRQARVGDASGGEILVMSLQFAEDYIVKARFLAYGSVAIIAVGEFVAEFIENKSIEELSQLQASDILQQLDLPLLKISTAALVVTAVKQAVKNYRAKCRSQ